MLTLYLVAHQQSQHQPTKLQVQQWIQAVEHSHIAHLTEPNSLVPSHGMTKLFDQNAQEALLPAELTFESLQIHWAPEVTFLPLHEIDLEIECRQCGDLFDRNIFYKNLQRLEFVPFSQLYLWCESCQMDIGRKGWCFSQTIAFAKFWILIEECGSTRLNPVLLKAWGELLGCRLDIIVEHREKEWLGWQEEVNYEWEDETMIPHNLMGIKPSRILSTKRNHRKKSKTHKKPKYW